LQYLKQVKTVVKLGDKERVEIFLSPKQLQVCQYMQTKDEVNPKEIRDDLGIITATVLQILNKLIAMEKIERLGEGRSTRYRKII
jgi:DNA-binding MarR family transcriptional regulator